MEEKKLPQRSRYVQAVVQNKGDLRENLLPFACLTLLLARECIYSVAIIIATIFSCLMNQHYMAFQH